MIKNKVIDQFNLRHKGKYDYSLVEYINNQTKVKIICPEHGVFEKKPANHKLGSGCPKCLQSNRIKTKEEIIADFKKIHKNRFDYSLVEYVRTNKKVKIICPEHGVFEQTPANHLKYNGCQKCKHQNLIINQKDIIKSFHLVHKDKYDYSLVEYIRNDIKVKIICPEHGIFEQTPNNHKSGQGCRKCAVKIIENNDKLYSKFKEIHNDKYDYSLVDFKSANENIKIICPEHGIFEHSVKQHLKGIGCKKCAQVDLFLTKEKILNQFEKVHGKKYDYSLVEYSGTSSKVKIICREHDIFEQVPMSHKRGIGCPQCKTNKKEEFLINLFREYNIKYYHNDRTLIAPFEIDFLIPDHKLGIEHNGLLWHSYGKSDWKALDNYYKLDKNRHLNKTQETEKKNYQLFHIREDQYNDLKKREIWKSILLNKCGISHKIHARKLQVVNLENYKEFTKTFLEENHLQGNCVSSIKLGLQDPKTGIVYSIMTFGKSRFDKNIEYELLRFCNLRYHNVRGAASKLMSTFEKTIKPTSIVSYANRDWSQGNLYKSLGFEFIKSTSPNYVYVNNTKIIKRQHVQKHKLKNFFKKENKPFWPELSERDNMINNGYRILYDTGNLVYHKNY